MSLVTFFAETFVGSLKKQGEELCGDTVEVVRTGDALIMVLADGLGSGVKASILSTLTSKIAASMLRQGASVDEVVATLAGTLPVCKVRGLAYSTFLIVSVNLKGREAYLVEYDCPDTFVIRKGQLLPVTKSVRTISGKEIAEARFPIEENDLFILASDGVLHAGEGGILNLGWQWEHVAHYLEKQASQSPELPELVQTLLAVCDNLYLRRPGDDVTVAGLRIRRSEQVTLLAGPPSDCRDDASIVEYLLAQPGKKVVCGGTTAQVVSRVSGRPLLTTMDQPVEGVPPTAEMPGLDLVTEGVLTLSRALQLIRMAKDQSNFGRNAAHLDGSDGASRLARLLLFECTAVRILLGGAENAAHRDLADRVLPRKQVVEAICNELRQMGKQVELSYC
ncbi:MAG: SpoIIE family protein phosphatase [Bacillota bacterium]